MVKQFVIIEPWGGGVLTPLPDMGLGRKCLKNAWNKGGSLNKLGNAMREVCQLNAVFQRLCARTRLEHRASDVILKNKP